MFGEVCMFRFCQGHSAETSSNEKNIISNTFNNPKYNSWQETFRNFFSLKYSEEKKTAKKVEWALFSSKILGITIIIIIMRIHFESMGNEKLPMPVVDAMGLFSFEYFSKITWSSSHFTFQSNYSCLHFFRTICLPAPLFYSRPGCSFYCAPRRFIFTHIPPFRCQVLLAPFFFFVILFGGFSFREHGQCFVIRWQWERLWKKW